MVASQNVDSTTYSTSEQVVGTWIDGEPLYRKVIQTTLSTSAIASMPNISPKRVTGFIVRSGGQYWSINTRYPADGNIACAASYSSQSGGLFANYGPGFTAGEPIIIIVEYTKTTS